MEIWKDIPNYEGLYQVSDMGRIRSLDRVDSLGRNWHGKIKDLRTDRQGYKYTSLYKFGKSQEVKAHRMVLLAFVGPSKLVCDHRNRDAGDNSLSNLEYVTIRENVIRGKKSSLKSNKKSPYAGVYASGNRFRAQASFCGERVTIGIFDTAEEARDAYNEAVLSKDPMKPLSEWQTLEQICGGES